MCNIPHPYCVAITANKTILVSTSTNQIFKVTQAGILSILLTFIQNIISGQKYEAVVIAGSGQANRLDEKPDECCFNNPYGIAVDEVSHSCYVADRFNHTIRKISFIWIIVERFVSG